MIVSDKTAGSVEKFSQGFEETQHTPFCLLIPLGRILSDCGRGCANRELAGSKAAVGARAALEVTHAVLPRDVPVVRFPKQSRLQRATLCARSLPVGLEML